MSSERWSEKAVAGILPTVVFSLAQLVPNIAEAASATAVLGGTNSIGQVGSVSINGSRVTFQGRISNYCGAPDSQRWVIPCAYNGLEITLSGLPNGNVSNAVFSLTVFGDHDSDPLPEDAEYINIHVDNTYLGRIFDGNPGNDRFNFNPGWADHGNLMSSPVSSSAQITSSELSAALADGTIRLRLGFEGQSHDDYSPWLLHGLGRSDYQEYMDFTFSYDISGTPVYDPILDDTDDNAPTNDTPDNTGDNSGGGDTSAPVRSPEPLQDGQIAVYASDDVGADNKPGATRFNVSKWDHGFIKFDLPAALGSLGVNDIESARFQINELAGGASSGLNVWRHTNTSWSEGGSVPNEIGFDHSSGSHLGTGASIDITQLAKAALAGDGIVSLELSHDSGSWQPFHSRESSEPPMIVITPASGSPDTGGNTDGGNDSSDSGTDTGDTDTGNTDSGSTDTPEPTEPETPTTEPEQPDTTDTADLQIYPSEDIGATGNGSNTRLYLSQWDHAFVRFDLNSSISNLSASDVVKATFTVAASGTDMPEGISVWESDIQDWSEYQGHKVKTYQSKGSGTLMGQGTSVDVTPLVQAALSTDGIVDLELTHLSGRWQSYDSREGTVPPTIIIETVSGSNGSGSNDDSGDQSGNDTDNSGDTGNDGTDNAGDTSVPTLDGQQTLKAGSDIGANNQADSANLQMSRWNHAFVRFQTAPVDVSQVFLRLHQNTSKSFELSVHEAEKEDWEEHSSIPVRSAAPFGNAAWLGSTSVSGAGWVAVDISAYAVDRLSNGQAISLELLTDLGTWATFSSSEGANAPELLLIP